MYPNAALIQQLAVALKISYESRIIQDIYSTSKTDLFFVFDNNKGIKFQIFQGIGFFQFFEDQTFPTKNRIQQFKSVHYLKIKSVNAHKNSRSFDFEFFGGQKLVFKLFGKFSNVILYDAIPKDIFCSNYPKDLHIPFTFFSEVKHTDSELIFSNTNPSHFYITKNEANYYELVEEESTNFIAKYQSITDVLSDYTRLFVLSEAFKTKKTGQINHLEKIIKQKKKLLADTFDALHRIKNKRSYSELADLLMANLHSIHTGTTTVEVLDFYNDTKLQIKIKKELNPQQNAALLYQKSKNEVKELHFKQKTIDELKIEIEKLEKSYNELLQVEDNKTLKIYDLTQASSSFNTQKEKSNPLPYKLFIIEEFEVMVGKNAKANDQLLSKFAHKNDLWFHAKDVSGSHVIIRNPQSKTISNYLLESAASLAAWHSKAKNSTFVAVIYTLRKFVRKPKGAPAGQVIVEKESTLLVKPLATPSF